ncbi:MAG TPA: hypothetical protein VE201_06460 [Nitrospirales bacterium]|nr:hypothetical protein [Nitrospirales bacterium]
MPDALVFAAQIKKLEAFRHGQADSTALDEFDAETEQLILRTLGVDTHLLEAYGLAIMGEAENIVNIPQQAQEDAAQDVPRKAIEQRRQVLEACMAELEAAPEQPKPPQPLHAPAKKARKATKTKPRAVKKKAAKKKRTARGKARKPTTAAKKKRAKRR